MVDVLNNLIDEIQDKGYTVETFSNFGGNRFGFRLWKNKEIIWSSIRHTKTWADLEPMYIWIKDHLIPELEASDGN